MRRAAAAALAVLAVAAPPAAAAPGDLLSSEATPVGFLGTPLPGAPAAWRITYASTSATGAANVVSGAVIVPAGAAADRPVLALGPSTAGFADRCAPSRQLRSDTLTEMPIVAAATARGWTVVLSDYEGLGMPGAPTVFAGRSEGHAMLDAVRAARGLGAHGPVGAIGYSQGGGAAAWAAQLQPSYAPDVPLAGVAAGAAAADLPAFVRAGSGTWGAGASLGVLLGLDAAHPELGLRGMLTWRGRWSARVVGSTCAVEWIGVLGNPRMEQLVYGDPFARPDWAARVAEHTPGAAAPTAPVLLWHGLGDRSVPVAGAERLRDDWRAAGADVTWRPLATDHAGALLGGTEGALAWLAERFRRG